MKKRNLVVYEIKLYYKICFKDKTKTSLLEIALGTSVLNKYSAPPDSQVWRSNSRLNLANFRLLLVPNLQFFPLTSITEIVQSLNFTIV